MHLLKRNIAYLLGLALILLTTQSCNKEFEDITANPTPTPGTTAGAFIETDANYSILKAAVMRAGLLDVLKNTGNKLTVFAPDDAAFTASGLTLAVVNALPVSQLQSILSYHIIPQSLPAAQIPTTFPNVQMPSLLPLPGNNPFVKMNIFPSRRNNSVFVNNIPVTQTDIAVGNGVIHKVARVVAPPSMLLAQIIATDADLSFFRAAITRADEGQTGLNRIDSIMKFGVASVTVFAPGNDAFKQLLAGFGLPESETSFSLLPVQTVRAIVAYHILGSRAFSVNMPTTATFIPTLLNGAIPNHPGVNVQATFTGPVVSSLKVTGVGNRGVSSNAVTRDIHAVNGVIHKIDQVLLPQ